MLFKFDANQEYQIRAIESVLNLFDGQPQLHIELQFAPGAGFAAVANHLDLDENALLYNLQAVQQANEISVDETLEFINQRVQTIEGKETVSFANFSIEMETGTGKTYVYIRTAMELFQRYGFRKFIIVVPSVAIREGVLKTFQVTEIHLRQLYANTPYRYYAYDSANLAQVRQFALSDEIEFMVMTIDSFNKASNIILQSTDRLQGETPIHLIQATRPILILDEPQNMESEQRIKALAVLNPLFALRYSATHRNPYNLLYRLTPFDAYRQRLVKRIEIAGVESEADINQAFIQLKEIKADKKMLSARLAVHKLMKNGTVKEQVVTVKGGDSLASKANRPDYEPYIVEEIDAVDGFVRFTNGITLFTGESRGENREAIFEAQIRYTIEEHFRKQARLKGIGIKVLSLFFLDKVDNYIMEDGVIRRLFSKAFNELKTGYADWRNTDPSKVQSAYFASRRTKSGQVVYEDSKTGEAEKDKQAYDLIMRDKERLLSFSEPTCFIFSHTALREGWDNPNVFQICTLNQTASDIKKRQEIGRGVRLAVNQAGDRVHNEQVNVLTVVANESYEHYVERYQSELVREFGTEGLPPRPDNARTRGTARLRKEYMLRPEFKELWERIKYKTRYNVKIDSEKLITDVVTDLNAVHIQPPRLKVSKAVLEADQTWDTFTTLHILERQGPQPYRDHDLPNLVEVMSNLLVSTTPSLHLTRRTLLEVVKRSSNKKAMFDNPNEFARVAVQIIKQKLSNQMINGIQYEKIDGWYEMTRFEAQIESWKDHLIPADRSIYDHVVYESDVEKRFVEGLEKREDVKLYMKLPAWFTVDTPIGRYNPDWAVVVETPDGRELLYLVRETKGTTDPEGLRMHEAQKIICGSRHFAALNVNFKVVTNIGELLP